MRELWGSPREFGKLCNFINLPTDGSTSAPACYSSNEARNTLLFFFFLWPLFYFSLLLLLLMMIMLLVLLMLLMLLLLKLPYNIYRVPGFEPEILQPQKGVLPMSYTHSFTLHFLTYNNACCTKQFRRHFLFPIHPVPATKLSK